LITSPTVVGGGSAWLPRYAPRRGSGGIRLRTTSASVSSPTSRQMPLHVQLIDPTGAVLDDLYR
ncbi:MAG TPA: hypothetical protein VGO16_02180, partial [Pseudonocardiaceae bacterium]|nr:hypothetical protein [Pseudonocardiaceae bacterium]